MEKMKASGLGGASVLLISVILILFPRFAQTIELDTNRPGRDYKSLDLPSPDPNMCERLCKEDPQNCKAWTYVKPEVQGPKARCWLKSGIPSAVKNACCVSGIVQQAPPAELLAQSGEMRKLTVASCPPLVLVSTSPLPSTGVGWDYKYQLEVSGGRPPYRFMTPYYDPGKGVLKGYGAYDPNSGTPIPTSTQKDSMGKPLTSFVPGGLKINGLYLTPWGSIEGQPWEAGGKTDVFVVHIVATDSCSPAQRVEKDYYLKVQGAAGPSPSQ